MGQIKIWRNGGYNPPSEVTIQHVNAPTAREKRAKAKRNVAAGTYEKIKYPMSKNIVIDMIRVPKIFK